MDVFLFLKRNCLHFCSLTHLKVEGVDSPIFLNDLDLGCVVVPCLSCRICLLVELLVSRQLVLDCLIGIRQIYLGLGCNLERFVVRLDRSLCKISCCLDLDLCHLEDRASGLGFRFVQCQVVVQLDARHIPNELLAVRLVDSGLRIRRSVFNLLDQLFDAGINF